jgi:hypothetical protein
MPLDLANKCKVSLHPNVVGSGFDRLTCNGFGSAMHEILCVGL